ncbi:MAG: hypothetical protein JWN44_4943 [Myxococcales bacterium]|nr:hypothetical protein [Myxococcales bacterium]
MKPGAWEKELAAAMRAADPVAAVRALHPGADADGVRMSALLVARLRFERLVRGSPAAEAWFDRDPADFARAFRRYHAEVAPRAFFPAGEAELFETWRASHVTPPLPARSRIVAPRHARRRRRAHR